MPNSWSPNCFCPEDDIRNLLDLITSVVCNSLFSPQHKLIVM